MTDRIDWFVNSRTRRILHNVQHCEVCMNWINTSCKNTFNTKQLACRKAQCNMHDAHVIYMYTVLRVEQKYSVNSRPLTMFTITARVQHICASSTVYNIYVRVVTLY